VRQSQGALDLNKPFTIELWARWWDGGAARMVPLCGDEVWRGMHATINAPGAAGFVLRRHRWKLDQFILDFTAGTTSNSWYQVWGRPIPRDTGWFHVAVVREPHRVRLYYNGEEIGRAAAQGVTFRASPTDLFLGTRLHAWMDRANAHDLRAFHVAQRALYDGPFLPPRHFTPDKQTEILLDFAQARGRRLPDLSGNMHDGIFDGPGIFDSIRGPGYATFEAEQGTWSRAWTRSERDLSSDGSEITIWSTFDTGQEGHWATLPIRVKKAGRYRILFAGSDLRQLGNRPSISPFQWRIGDQRAWTPAHAEVVLPGRHNLALIGERQLAAGEHMFGLKLHKKRQRPDQRWALRFDALVLQRIEGER